MMNGDSYQRSTYDGSYDSFEKKKAEMMHDYAIAVLTGFFLFYVLPSNEVDRKTIRKD